LAERLLPLRSRLIDAFGRVQARALLSRRIRCHGDYRLDQLPFTGNDFVVVDFEGDPRMSGGQRRIKRSPLRDVASLLFLDQIAGGFQNPRRLPHVSSQFRELLSYSNRFFNSRYPANPAAVHNSGLPA